MNEDLNELLNRSEEDWQRTYPLFEYFYEKHNILLSEEQREEIIKLAIKIGEKL